MQVILLRSKLWAILGLLVSTLSLAGTPSESSSVTSTQDVPSSTLSEGEYQYTGTTTYLAGDTLSIIRWVDGQMYLKATLPYGGNNTITVDLPVVPANDGKTNHFKAEGLSLSTYEGETFETDFDIYSFVGKIYVAIFSPSNLDSHEGAWLHYEKPWDLHPNCSCQTEVFNQVPWCILEPAHRGIQGSACTQALCDSLTQQLGSNCANVPVVN